MTSVLSILHRGTGVVIALGAVLIAAWFWTLVQGEASFTWMSEILNSPIGKILVFLWSACTAYHLCNAIRHLVWDAGYGYEIKQAYLSGKLVLLGAALITLGVWML